MNPFISGSTQLVLMIGDPIAQVKTPMLFNARLADLGLDAVMVPMRIAAGGLPGLMAAVRAAPNVRGLVITLPHKQAMLTHVDALAEVGRQVQAVNVIRREPDGALVGDILDGQALVDALRRAGRDPAGARVMQIGAGGVGSAILFALVKAGAAQVRLFDMDEARAADLAGRANAFAGREVCAPGPAATAGFDLLINASPVGMAEGDGVPCGLSEFSPSLFVFDVVAARPVTALMRTAKDAGASVLGGQAMIDAQVDALVATIFPEADPG